ncbi:unnamed protein product, partial [Effrenium voratum]
IRQPSFFMNAEWRCQNCGRSPYSISHPGTPAQEPLRRTFPIESALPEKAADLAKMHQECLKRLSAMSGHQDGSCGICNESERCNCEEVFRDLESSLHRWQSLLQRWSNRTSAWCIEARRVLQSEAAQTAPAASEPSCSGTEPPCMEY